MAQKKFVCSVCGYVHIGDAAPEVCPQCKQSGVFVEEKKKGIDTNSNTYTIVYSTILVVIVAVLLALVSQVLSPRQEANILLDKQKQILGALKIDYSTGNPADIYMALVNDTLTYDKQEVYVANLNGATKYVLTLSGKGLWGGIGGYLALDADKNTIYGVNFNHASETPGLGAKIVEMPFREQFEGKHIRNNAGEVVSVAVLKKGKKAEVQEQVDAISGATITCDGVNNMIATNLEEYAAFLNENVEPINTEEE
jgi:Na+-transporting NADH:ubiquinone oxidoreductase subunit C